MNGLNIGGIACLVFAIVFGIFAVIFLVLKERAAMLVSGFNTMPKEKRARYDTKRISTDYRNMLFLWAVVFAAGAIASYLLTPYMAVAAFAIWLVLFFKEVRLDEEKAFEKYEL